MASLSALLSSESCSTAVARKRFMAFVSDAESERVIRRVLPELTAEDDSVWRGDIATAIEHLTKHRTPDLLIVDISGQDLPLPQIRHLSEVCEPGAQVIVIGEHNEVDLYRDLVQSGIADYVVKPLTDELISRAVDVVTHRVAGTAVSQKVGKVIAVMGMRGGIGTTTVAVNLAWDLANRVGRRVALVDLDLQTGDCGLMLDLKGTSALREALENSSQVDNLYLERVMVPHGDRLFVLSAEESLRDELRLAPDGVEKLITAMQSNFHYVVIDIPRMPSAATQRAIDIATLRVLVADETFRSAREILRLREVLSQGQGAEHNLLVINRSGERRRGYIPRGEFLATIEMQAALTIPLVSESHVSCAAYGRPLAADRGPIAQAIETLVAEITGRPVARKNRWWTPWR